MRTPVSDTTVIALVPPRTNSSWWHNTIAGKAAIFFLKGRLSFGDGSQPPSLPAFAAGGRLTPNGVH
ncbi:MAG: hypothetical protein ACKPGI_17370 [Verrucomicrobiota bacterium]